MRLRRTGLVRQHEPRADPHSTRTQHERGGERLPVEQAAGGDDLDVLAGHGALVALDHGHDGGDEDGGGHVAGVAAALAALRADDVDAGGKALLHVLGVPDHVHVEDAGAVELLDDGLGRHADGGDEEFGAGFDDDVDEVVELALGVVVAGIQAPR